MFTKEVQVRKDVEIISLFYEGKSDYEIASIITDKKFKYRCGKCGGLHEWRLKPIAIYHHLYRLKLLPEDKYLFIDSLIQRHYKRIRARHSYKANKNAGKKYFCESCGSIENLEVHHITPLWRGGTDEKNNLKVLCHDCHMRLP